MQPSSAQPVSINLLEHETDDSVFNRLTNWAVTYGRYIMIGTEIVVLLAFISRFSLDRKLTDLREEISQKQIILTANQDFEQQFRNTQKRIDAVKSLLQNQSDGGPFLFILQSLLPQDVYLTEYRVVNGTLEFSAIAGSTESFSRFLLLLTQQKKLRGIEITDIRKQATRGIEFRITATISKTPKS